MAKRRFVIGVVANGRSERLSDPLGALGLFWNIIPFKAIIQDNKKKQIRLYDKALLDLEPYTLYPLSKIASKQNKHDASLFSVTFNFINFHNVTELQQQVLKIQETKFWDRFHYPLNFIITLRPGEKDNVYIRLEYEMNNFHRQEMEKLIENYVNNLQKIIQAEFSLA